MEILFLNTGLLTISVILRERLLESVVILSMVRLLKLEDFEKGVVSPSGA